MSLQAMIRFLTTVTLHLSLHCSADIVFSIRDASDDVVLPVGIDDSCDFFQIQSILECSEP